MINFSLIGLELLTAERQAENEAAPEEGHGAKENNCAGIMKTGQLQRGLFLALYSVLLARIPHRFEACRNEPRRGRPRVFPQNKCLEA